MDKQAQEREDRAEIIRLLKKIVEFLTGDKK